MIEAIIVVSVVILGATVIVVLINTITNWFDKGGFSQYTWIQRRRRCRELCRAEKQKERDEKERVRLERILSTEYYTRPLGKRIRQLETNVVRLQYQVLELSKKKKKRRRR